MLLQTLEFSKNLIGSCVCSCLGRNHKNASMYTTQQCVFHKNVNSKTDMMFENYFKRFKLFRETIIYLNFDANCHSFHTIGLFLKTLMIFFTIFRKSKIYIFVATWQVQNSIKPKDFVSLP